MEKEKIELLKERAMELNEQLIGISDAVAKEKMYHVARYQGNHLGNMDFVIYLCNGMLNGDTTISEELWNRMEEMCDSARHFVVNHEER